MGKVALCREQTDAAKHSIESPLVVLAGPGSGKTTVLVSRIEFMVEEKKINPDRILTLTFSNSAAKELRARVLAGGSRLCVHTFHSFCWALLLDCNLVTPFTSVYDDFASLRLVKDCVLFYRSQADKVIVSGQPAPRQKPRAILDAINKFKVNATTLESVRNLKNLTQDQMEVIAIWTLLEDKKQQHSAVDFNDMLLLAIHVLRQSTATRTRYQQLYPYVLVDEYQDTNSLQFELLCLLVPTSPGRVTIVGDDDQSIYRWRGATLANWNRFKEVYRSHATVHLRVNFRSSPPIIAACNGLISFNQSRLKHASVVCGAKTPHMGAVCLTSCQSSATEAMHVAEKIRRLVNDGVCSFKDVAVLFRSNPQGATVKRLASSLKSMGIPFVSSQDAITSDGERNVVAALTLLVNPSDGVALSFLLQEVCGIKRFNLELSLEQILGGDVPPTLARYTASLKTFSDFVHHWTVMCNTGSSLRTLVDQIIQDIAEGCDMSVFLTRGQFEGKQEADMREQIGELLHSVCLVPLVPAPQNAVTLSTIHRAKGLEWDTVFAIQLAENVNWGSKKKTLSTHETDEERRVMYVCFSRAQKRLFMSHPNSANGERTAPLRFVHEVKKRGGNIQKLKCARGVTALARALSVQTKQVAERAAKVLAMRKLAMKTPRKSVVVGKQPETNSKQTATKTTPTVKHNANLGPPLSLFQGLPSWQCLVCTFKNTVTREFCGMCNTATPKTPSLLRETTSPFPVPVSCASASSSPPSVSFLRAIFDEQDDEEEGAQKETGQKIQDEEEEVEAIPPLESMPELIRLSPQPLQARLLQPQRQEQFKRKLDDQKDAKPAQTLSSLPSLVSVFHALPSVCSSSSAPISSPSACSTSCSVATPNSEATVRPLLPISCFFLPKGNSKTQAANSLLNKRRKIVEEEIEAKFDKPSIFPLLVNSERRKSYANKENQSPIRDMSCGVTNHTNSGSPSNSNFRNSHDSLNCTDNVYQREARATKLTDSLPVSNEGWRCFACTLQNPPQATVCELCEFSCPSDSQSPAAHGISIGNKSRSTSTSLEDNELSPRVLVDPTSRNISNVPQKLMSCVSPSAPTRRSHFLETHNVLSNNTEYFGRQVSGHSLLTSIIPCGSSTPRSFGAFRTKPSNIFPRQKSSPRSPMTKSEFDMDDDALANNYFRRIRR